HVCSETKNNRKFASAIPNCFLHSVFGILNSSLIDILQYITKSQNVYISPNQIGKLYAIGVMP
ncbi:MAG: hypothetical protein WBY28_05100, partial [Nitrososphaeraceae archaeon]